VRTSVDHDNCGQCGRGCGDGECQGGECQGRTVATYGERIYVPFAVNATRVFWAIDNVIMAKVLPTGEEMSLATVEGQIESLTADDQYVYVMHREGGCTNGWCLRKLALAPGSVPEPPWYTVRPSAGPLINDARALYWFDELLGGRVVGLEKGPGPARVREYGTNQGSPAFVAVDEQYIYWRTDQAGEGTIKRARLDGTGPPEPLVTGLADPVGIAVDRDNVYWTERLAGLVRMAPKRVGAQPKTIGAGLQQPRSIVVRGTSVHFAATYSNSLYRYSLCDEMLHISGTTESAKDLAVMGDYVYLSEKGRIVRFAP
jgi:hypothetical protein